jgi:hypothetical protein
VRDAQSPLAGPDSDSAAGAGAAAAGEAAAGAAADAFEDLLLAAAGEDALLLSGWGLSTRGDV